MRIINFIWLGCHERGIMKHYNQEQKPMNPNILYKKIETLDDARAFIRHLVQTGNMYHPDDDALECMNNGESSFEEQQANALNRRMDEAWDVGGEWGRFGDIHAYSMYYMRLVKYFD